MPFTQKCSPAQCETCPSLKESGLQINRITATPNGNGSTIITLLNVNPQTRGRTFFGNFQVPGVVSPEQAAALVEARATEYDEPVPVRSWGRTAVGCCLALSDEQLARCIERVEVTAEALAPEISPGKVAA